MKCRSSRAIWASRRSSRAKAGAQSMSHARASSLLPIPSRVSAASSRCSSGVMPHGYSGDHRFVATALFHTSEQRDWDGSRRRPRKRRRPSVRRRGQRGTTGWRRVPSRGPEPVSRGWGTTEPPESPVARRSCRTSRENCESRSNRSASASSSHMVSTLPQFSSSRTRSTGPSPTVWYAMLMPSAVVAYCVSGSASRADLKRLPVQERTRPREGTVACASVRECRLRRVSCPGVAIGG